MNDRAAHMRGDKQNLFSIKLQIGFPCVRNETQNKNLRHSAQMSFSTFTVFVLIFVRRTYTKMPILQSPSTHTNGKFSFPDVTWLLRARSYVIMLANKLKIRTSNWFDGLTARWSKYAEHTLRLNVVIDKCPHDRVQTATACTFDHPQFDVGQYFCQRFIVDSIFGHCCRVHQICREYRMVKKNEFAGESNILNGALTFMLSVRFMCVWKDSANINDLLSQLWNPLRPNAFIFPQPFASHIVESGVWIARR